MQSGGCGMLGADVKAVGSASSGACGNGARAALTLRAQAAPLDVPPPPRARSTKPVPRPKPGAGRGNTRSVKPEPRVRPTGARSNCPSMQLDVELTPQVRNGGSGSGQNLEALVGETEALADAPLAEGGLTGLSIVIGRPHGSYVVPCDQDRAQRARVSDALGGIVARDTSEQLNGATQTISLDNVLGTSADISSEMQTGANAVHYQTMLEVPDVSDFSDSSFGDQLDSLSDLGLS
eukprot:TRINITY_DN6332_c0_g2_i1.p1 TRINITY_DN6332_c0_g2~~TRINITY_DN6332_c0_g2_i1.p1  ORF type:complete len:236 (+),score=28.29 TRINITY_DN6332_c0_g2_i1:44-751(+)